MINNLKFSYTPNLLLISQFYENLSKRLYHFLFRVINHINKYFNSFTFVYISCVKS